MTLSSEKLDELRDAAEKATPGPWFRVDGFNNELHQKAGALLHTSTNNLDYLALCDPTTIASLIAEVKAARANASMRDLVAELDVSGGSNLASVVAASRAHTEPGEVVPVAWQWSDFSGKWYMVDTARLALADQEELARHAAVEHSGRIRPLFASPPAPLGVTGKRIEELEATPHETREGSYISLQTLKWWRELVDLNPADLAPRLDAVIAARAALKGTTL